MKRGIPQFNRPLSDPRRSHAPSSAAAWNACYDRGRALSKEHRLEEALAEYRMAVAAAPEAMEPRRELATTLFALGRAGEALHEFNDLSLRFPHSSEAANNLAKVLVALGRFELAFEAAQRALALDAQNVVAMHNLAEILKHLGSWDAARDVYAASLSLDPDQPRARMQYGMIQVALGDWKAGWEAMEERTAAIGPSVLFPEAPPSPRWDGAEPIATRHILIQHEQGLGDSIMMVRFARTLADRGAIVHVRCPAPLTELLQTAGGVATCTAVGTPFPPHDLHVPLMSLPALLAVTAEQVDGTAYLSPPGACPPHIVQRLPRDGVPTVAVTWAGNPLHINDHRRSIAGELLAPLLQLDGVRFVAMQKVPAMADVLPAALRHRIADVGAECGSFAESAHALQRVDLVVTVDTAVAHLAGAIGTPTLLCLPFCPDFRWGVSHARSPWYDGMTILRQREASGWSDVIADVVARVGQLRDTSLEVH